MNILNNKLNTTFELLPFTFSIKKDDVVFISSDLKNLAFEYKKLKKKLDIDLFISNFQEVLSEGTLIFPAYTDNLKNGDCFNVLKSKPNTGALSNKVFKRKEFKRTLEPLHSVFVWGKKQNEALNYVGESTFGEKSIYQFLKEKNALFIFIDVHIVNSFTFIHHIEEVNNVPYRKFYKRNFYLIDENNNKIKSNLLFHTKKPGVVTDFNELNKLLLERNIMKRYNLLSVNIDCVRAKETINLVEELLNKKKYLYYLSLKEMIKKYIKSILVYLKLK